MSTPPETPSPPAPADQLVETTHRLTVNGETVNYTATAGTLVLREEDKERGHQPKATVFFTAYTRSDPPPDGRPRPLSFAFNGGPGSSSVWLHLGLLGPRRVALQADGALPPPPYRLIDNPHTLLTVSDLVLIDPVSTGYSRAAAGEKPEQFHAFEKDIATVGEFIRLYTTRYGRWDSPIYLIGESYGTTRAAGLSGYLQQEVGLYLSGIALISSVLDFQTLSFEPNNDLPYLLYLPTYAATAWYHGRLGAAQALSLAELTAEAEEYAMGEYAVALLQGDRLPAARSTASAERLAALTGLTAEFVLQNNLRVPIQRFVKELLRSERRTVGRLDSRFTGVDRDAAGETVGYDPSYATIQGPYTATLNQYVRRDLGFESDLPYEILTGKVQPWQYTPFQNRYVETAETLRDAICRNPHLRVFVASGVYDLATPYLATTYTLAHLGLEPHLRANIVSSHYEAGHMMYIHEPSLALLGRDLAAFVQPDAA